MIVCPTPQKQAFKSMATARKFAIKRALWALEEEKPFTAIYGYRCECGRVHLTSRKRWDGRRHLLMARLRPHRAMMLEGLRTQVIAWKVANSWHEDAVRNTRDPYLRDHYTVAAHALGLVLAALDGETDPAELGVAPEVLA